MENTARLFHCARCRCQVVICRRCDRGNIYCGGGCAQQARGESVRAAGGRYQRSRRGRFAHAARQRRYRSRRRKVTHQGSSPVPPHASLSPESRVLHRHDTALPVGHERGARCQFCQRPCSPFLRLDFLHSGGPRLIRPPGGRSPPQA